MGWVTGRSTLDWIWPVFRARARNTGQIQSQATTYGAIRRDTALAALAQFRNGAVREAVAAPTGTAPRPAQTVTYGSTPTARRSPASPARPPSRRSGCPRPRLLA